LLRNSLMKSHVSSLAALLLCVCAGLCPPPAGAYSVLSHEEVIDMAWKDRIVPMLKARFPGLSDDDIRQAHAYAYGGSVIQDIGYYPFGSHYFSDLLHYVRPQDFVNALLRDSTTPDEYAFALGALAHYCGDAIGHPAINEVTAEENPALQHRFGQAVTYGEDPTAHLRTEFGFDVVEVAQGHYSQDNYRDFIGFQVARQLLNRAFQETYGIPVTDVMKHEDLAIGSYRRAVSSLIPKMTRIAFVSYKKQIQQAAPGIDKRRFLYRLNQTEYEKNFGTDYYHVGLRGHIAAFFIQITPKIGPFKALKVTLPNPQEQDIYLKSINATVDKFRLYLAEIHAPRAPLPPTDPKDAEAARKVADKVAKEVDQAKKTADGEKDPEEKASLERVAENLQRTSELASDAADRTETKVANDQAVRLGLMPAARIGVPSRVPVRPPSTPTLPELDLDTGRPSSAGEYRLADETYARLLGELVAPGKAGAPHAAVDPALAADLERFFAHPIAPSGPELSQKEAAQKAALLRKALANLAVLKAGESQNR
jgi:hypothetical protein